MATFLSVDIENFYDKYNCEYLVVRDREIITTNLHKVKATIIHKSTGALERYSIPEKEFESIERVGSGDAFDAGIIHELLNSGDIKKMLDFGMTAFLIKHLIKGDALNLSEEAILNWKNEK